MGCFCSRPPFFDYCTIGDTKSVKTYIVSGASIDIQDKTNGHFHTGLILACIAGKLEVVSMLIEAKANLDISDWSYTTALMYTIKYHQYECMELLVKAGASMEKGVSNNTPVILACEEKDDRYLKLLLDNDVSITAEDLDRIRIYNNGYFLNYFSIETSDIKII